TPASSSSPLPRRAIIAATSATAPLHQGQPTGLFIFPRPLDPFNVFKDAGFEVDIVSEKGTCVPDWLSLQPDFLDGEDKEQWEDLNGEFRTKLDNMPAAADVADVESVDGKNATTLCSLMYPSLPEHGHAALIDYPHATGLQKIATDVWNRDGVLSAVCHGEAIFPGIIDSTTGKSVIAGKTITGFTTQAEYDMNLMDPIRSWGEPLIDEWAEKLGAKYVRSEGVWDDFHVTDGRIVTGMNPQSAKSTAKAAVDIFQKL
ncbi:plasma membrane heat shock protein, partial [Knufia peltigerae]